jgi:hypothetical protein
MKLQELNIQELENRFEMSVAAEEPSITIDKLVIHV